MLIPASGACSTYRVEPDSLACDALDRLAEQRQLDSLSTKVRSKMSAFRLTNWASSAREQGCCAVGNTLRTGLHVSSSLKLVQV